MKPKALNPPTRITPVAERDKALKNHLESTHFFDEKTNKLWKPYP